jgi:hypothetical protein
MPVAPTNLVAITNAFLMAVLPEVSEMARKLELPVVAPILQEHLARGVVGFIEDRHGVSAFLVLKSGAEFSYNAGHASGFRLASSYFALQDPDDIPKFYGTPRLSQAECQQIVLRSLERLGYTNVVAILPAPTRVVPGARTDGQVVPRYRFEWRDPEEEGGYFSVQAEIDSDHGRLHALELLGDVFRRPPPKLTVPLPTEPRPGKLPFVLPTGAEELSTTHCDALVRRIWPEVLGFLEQIGQPPPKGGPDEEVDPTETKCFRLRGRLCCQVTLRSGQRFGYRLGHVFDYTAADAYFTGRYLRYTTLEPEDFLAEYKYLRPELVAIGRAVLKDKLRLDSARFHLDAEPIVRAGGRQIKGRKHMRRLLLDWGPPWTPEEMEREGQIGIFRASNIDMEMDTVTGEIKLLFIDAEKLPPRPDPDLSLPEAAVGKESGAPP